MTTKVFVVLACPEDGEVADIYVAAVFSTSEKAELWVKQNVNSIEYYKIEPHDVDPVRYPV